MPVSSCLFAEKAIALNMPLSFVLDPKAQEVRETQVQKLTLSFYWKVMRKPHTESL